MLSLVPCHNRLHSLIVLKACQVRWRGTFLVAQILEEDNKVEGKAAAAVAVVGEVAEVEAEEGEEEGDRLLVLSGITTRLTPSQHFYPLSAFPSIELQIQTSSPGWIALGSRA